MSKKKVATICLIGGGMMMMGITGIAYSPLLIIVGVFASLYGLFK